MERMKTTGFISALIVATWPLALQASTPNSQVDTAGLEPAALEGGVRLADNHDAASGSSREAKIRTAFETIDCAPLTTIDDGQSIRVTGFMSSETELDQLKSSIASMADIGSVSYQIVITTPSFCDILKVSLPLHERNSIESAGASISVDGNAVVLEEGDKVVLQATAPQFESYVYVVYLQENGDLINLVPSETDRDNKRGISEDFSIGDQPDQLSFSVAPPYGDDLVMLIASSEPLFSEPRPLTETGSVFAAALADSIAHLLDGEGKVVADLVFLRTSARLGETGQLFEGNN